MRCVIKSCKSTNVMPSKPSFFKFSTVNQPRKRQLWIEIVRKVNKNPSWMPKKSSKICGLHFVSGKHSPRSYEKDYVPTIFGPEDDVEVQVDENNGRSQADSGNDLSISSAESSNSSSDSLSAVVCFINMY